MPEMFALPEKSNFFVLLQAAFSQEVLSALIRG